MHRLCDNELVCVFAFVTLREMHAIVCVSTRWLHAETKLPRRRDHATLFTTHTQQPYATSRLLRHVSSVTVDFLFSGMVVADVPFATDVQVELCSQHSASVKLDGFRKLTTLIVCTRSWSRPENMMELFNQSDEAFKSVTSLCIRSPHSKSNLAFLRRLSKLTDLRLEIPNIKHAIRHVASLSGLVAFAFGGGARQSFKLPVHWASRSLRSLKNLWISPFHKDMRPEWISHFKQLTHISFAICEDDLVHLRTLVDLTHVSIRVETPQWRSKAFMSLPGTLTSLELDLSVASWWSLVEIPFPLLQELLLNNGDFPQELPLAQMCASTKQLIRLQTQLVTPAPTQEHIQSVLCCK